VILTISKADGSIVGAVEIKDPSKIGDINPPSQSSYRF